MARDGKAPIRNLAERIAAAIRSGEYPPGARLRQETLAERFKVSRTPVREALRVLEAKRVLELVPNQGAVVRVPGEREIREAYQVRAELEGLAAELAAQWISETQIERLALAEARFRQSVDALAASARATASGAKAKSGRALRPKPNWVESNEAFHDVVLEAAGNERLRAMLDDLHAGFVRPVMMATTAIDGRWMRENVAQHEAILAAIARHDATEARRQMTHHVKRSGELMVRWLEGKAAGRRS
jgi:DNA-binding GntR family transcriptional regulator